MTEPNEQRDPLETIVSEFVERQRRGESPSVAEYAARYPELAKEIRELLPTVAAMERLKAQRERSSDGRATLGPVQLERLGDFRIIREIGRGGMGVVFEAEQESLGRRVAIKVLPRQSLLDARQLTRFRREAHVAGLLHHTNIVQVFGAGENDGFHYYVMQFVRGVGLDDVIARLAGNEPGETRDDDHVGEVCRFLTGGDGPARPFDPDPQYWRAVARIGTQAAEAIQYAHDQGTIHRDIKPSNLLADEAGAVWITDFGLARSTESRSITQPGDITGTLRYLAPERFVGRADEKGDIYSLALTLYELLTLRPAFEQTDRAALIRDVSQSSPNRPRKHNPHIPRDLETIVLKAIARESGARYASAGALAADLQRFLDDRPILARRTGLGERLWRWCRRNPAVASLTGVSVLLLAAVAAVATVGYVRTNRALEGEATQRRKSEAVASLAQEVLDRIFDRLSPVRTLELPQLAVDDADLSSIEMPAEPIISRETAALLEEMLPFYDRLAQEIGDDLAIQRRVADANRRVGDIRQRLGQFDLGAAAYNRAIDIYRELGDNAGDGAGGQLRIAQVDNELGRLHRDARDLDQARQAHMAALAILEAAWPESGEPAPELAFEYARTCYFLGTRVPEEPGVVPRGLGGQGRGPMGRRGMGPPPRPPGAPGSRGPRGPLERAELAGRLMYLGTAVSLLKTLTDSHPANPQYRRLLALCYRDGYPDIAARDRHAANDYVDEAIEILDRLAKEFPQAPDYQFDLCEAYATVDLRDPGLTNDDLKAIEQRLLTARGISGDLTGRYPYVPQYLAGEANISHKLGDALRRLQRSAEAEQADRQAVQLQEAVVRQLPDTAIHQVWLTAYRDALGNDLLALDRPSETRDLMEQTAADLRRLLAANPDMWFVNALLAQTDRTLAVAYRRLGQHDRADDAEADAQQRRQQVRQRAPRGRR